MTKKQLQEDISESQEEEFQENLTEEEGIAVDAAWEETLNSKESSSFIDNLIAEGLKEIK